MANDRRLIDANALVAELSNDRDQDCNRYMYWYQKAERDAKYDFAIDRITEAETVDAVEVVLCKDCKSYAYMGDGLGDCTNERFHLDGHTDPTMKPDDFCSLGERRENGQA